MVEACTGFITVTLENFTQTDALRLLIRRKVEAALMSSNYMDIIMVYAEPLHSYCVALVVPPHNALEVGQETGIKHQSMSELCHKAEKNSEVQVRLLFFIY